MARFTTAFLASLILLSGNVHAENGSPRAVQNGDGRSTINEYVAAAVAGDFEKAAKLAVAGSAPQHRDQIEDLRTVVNKKLHLITVSISEAQGCGIAVSEAVVEPERQQIGVMVFELSKHGEKWLIEDIDFDSTLEAKTKLVTFNRSYPDATRILDLPKQ